MKVYSEVRKRPRVRTVNLEPSLTVQSDAAKADIRKILSKYKEIGILDHMRNVQLTYADVSQFSDFADMARATKEAQKAFMKLPSKVRELFNHDHLVWLDCAHDPEQLEALRPQLEELGVIEKAAAPVSAPAVPAATPAP